MSDEQQRTSEGPRDVTPEPEPGPETDRAAEATSAPATDPLVDAVTDAGPDTDVDLPVVVVERATEAAVPLGPLGLAGSGLTGIAMGLAEIVPGFSGGTVALVAGIYERLIANIRQGARALSLLLRGQVPAAVRALLVIEWPFVVVLFLPMVLTIFLAAARLEALLEERVVETQAVFLGLVLGAAVVASRQLRRPAAWHWLLALGAGAGFFVVLGFGPVTVDDPSLLVLAAGGAIAVCAWILPGVSGSFLLVLLGLYPVVIGAVSDRDLLALVAIALGLLAGITAFSTLLNWLLARAHDIVLAVLIGLMLGSIRVLWPWPADAGFAGSTDIVAPPSAGEGFLALALGLAAFGLVWMFGLAGMAAQRWRLRRAEDPAAPYPP